MGLASDLDALVDAIEQRGLNIRDYIQPGLDEETITDRLAEVGITAPEALQSLYQWGNGQTNLWEESDDDPDAISLFDEHSFLPLDEALSEYEQMVPIYQENQDAFGIDFAKCFPFASFMGSDYAIYCGDNPLHGLQYPIIRMFEDVTISFLNLQTMIATLTAWYRQGAYRPDAGDEALMEQIRDNLNPNLPLL